VIAANDLSYLLVDPIHIAMESPKAGERIYIGGLDPARLTGRDILRRLQSLQCIEIESASIPHNEINKGDHIENSENSNADRPYVHITVISKHPSDSAFSIIHKHYHNVKWKGCKLVVELAKPHFLERLKQERLDRQTRLIAIARPAGIDTIKDQELEKETPPNFIPRRLRVKKKYGDEAVHVDTKPWTVETWSRFNKARYKLKAREEKYHEIFLTRVSLSTPLIHRSVHIRFLTEDNSTTNQNVSSQENTNKIVDVMVSSSESANSNYTESESSNEDIGYEWSDDDDNSHSANSEKNEYSSEQKSNYIFSNQGPNVSSSIARQNENTKKYEWSTDDDLSNQEEESLRSTSSREDQELILSGTDEFVSGFGDTSDNIEHNGNKIDHPKDHESCDGFNQVGNGKKILDLSTDVTTNLHILSNIFPGMSNARPCDIDSEYNINLDDGNNTSFHTKKKNSNIAHTIMPRYDPSVKSSRIYNVEEESTQETEGKISAKNLAIEEKVDAEDVCENQIDDNNLIQTKIRARSLVELTVYEQDKLENIFRGARNAWGIDQVITIKKSSTNMATSNPGDASRNSSFNFGFNIDDEHSEKLGKQVSKSDATQKSFSFSFNVGGQDHEDGNSIASIDANSTIEQKDSKILETRSLSSDKDYCKEIDGDSIDETANRNSDNGIKGFTLSDEDLKKCVAKFFACNNGVRIMQHPHEFINDENDKALWNRERQTLTLDWKRKRKYAVTRIQKRMKVRRW